MRLLLGLLILALLLVPLAIAIKRSTELFVLEVEGGRVRVVRGRIPPRLLADIEEVVGRPPVPRAQIRVVTEGGAPRVLPGEGLDPGRLQQLRNVVGMWEVAKIRAGRR